MVRKDLGYGASARSRRATRQLRRDWARRLTRQFGRVKKDLKRRNQRETEFVPVNADRPADSEGPGRAGGRTLKILSDTELMAQLDTAMKNANPAWAAMLGWSEQELMGQHIFDLLHPHDIDRILHAARSLAEGTTLGQFDSRYRHKDGSYRWITWTAGPGEGHLTASARDIVVEKEHADALHYAEDALRQSQKMASVGQLTSGLAHDFNNLLTVISGSLKLLDTRLAQGQTHDLAQYISAAQGASARAAALTRRLLAFSRRHPLDPKATTVNGLISDMLELIRRTMGPKVAVEVVTTVTNWTTLIDPNQFENALLNLCLNARDAMPQGGRLKIETTNTWLDESVAQEYGVPVGDYVALIVSDTGCGMTPEVIDRAFDPFFTTKPSGMGTGLGLSMIYSFARRSGGQARIESEPGHGATVCLYFPRHLGEAANAEVAKEAEAPGDLAVALRTEQGETVLVVDDEPTVRDVVTSVLQGLGYKVIEAEDGEAGLNALRSDALIDLLVTDIGLPGGMDGQQMADAGRVVRPNLKVLFITGYDETAVFGEGPLEAGTQMLAKPFRMDVLAQHIKDLIARP